MPIMSLPLDGAHSAANGVPALTVIGSVLVAGLSDEWESTGKRRGAMGILTGDVSTETERRKAAVRALAIVLLRWNG